MLDRKEALLTALRNLNQAAESSPTGLTPQLRAEIDWVMMNLNKTNAALMPASERLRGISEREQEFRPEPVPEEWLGQRVTKSVVEVLGKVRRNAHIVLQRHQQSASADKKLKGDLGGQPTASALIESCMALILALRQCADNRQQGSISPFEVNQCLSLALQSLRPKSALNAKLFSEIESSVSLLRNEIF